MILINTAKTSLVTVDLYIHITKLPVKTQLNIVIHFRYYEKVHCPISYDE